MPERAASVVHDRRVKRAWAMAGAAALLGALGSVPSASAATGTLQVSASGGVVTVAADSSLSAFSEFETLVITSDKRSVTVLLDEGSTWLWSASPGCTAAPRTAPVATITCTGSFADVTVDMSATTVATQTALNGLARLKFTGGAGPDYVQGGDGNDQLRGEVGDDDLFGGKGDDRIEGGPGRDTVEGELGVDAMYGGPGVDDVEAQDDIADKVVDCGGQAGDTVSYDLRLDKPEACDGPTFSVMHPQAGATSGGTRVKLMGRGLDTLVGVAFGGAAGTIVSASDTEAIVITPAGTGRATVTLDLGAKKLAGGAFTYAPPPVLTRVTPASGGAGTVITLIGTDLARIHRITIGGIAVQPVAGRTVSVLAPPSRRIGTVDITIITAGGTSTLRNAFRYTP